MMKYGLLKTWGLVACTLLFQSSTAWAVTVYSTDNAVSDSYHSGYNSHGLWMPGLEHGSLSPDFTFHSPGLFTQSGTTATLTGAVVNAQDMNRRWNINVNFSGLTTTAPPNSPKKELKAMAYTNNGGPVDPSTWSYYTNFSGTLTGAGLYEGATIYLNRFGPAFQIGEGANGKNIALGGAGWFSWNVTQQPLQQGLILQSRYNHGDFNLNFSTPPTTPTPEPSAIILLGSGLAGIFALRHKKAQKAHSDT